MTADGRAKDTHCPNEFHTLEVSSENYDAMLHNTPQSLVPRLDSALKRY